MKIYGAAITSYLELFRKCSMTAACLAASGPGVKMGNQ